MINLSPLENFPSSYLESMGEKKRYYFTNEVADTLGYFEFLT